MALNPLPHPKQKGTCCLAHPETRTKALRLKKDLAEKTRRLVDKYGPRLPKVAAAATVKTEVSKDLEFHGRSSNDDIL